jgi:protein subunit release factor A
LAPLESDLVALEGEIAEIEAGQAKLTKHMSSTEISTDGAKMQEASIAYNVLSDKLETTYSKWTEVSDKIEKFNAEFNE